MGCIDGLYKIQLSARASVKLKGISSEVTSVKRSLSGDIFVGTREEGLWLVKNDKLVNIYPGTVFELEEDKDGILWLATGLGLVKLKKNAQKNFSSTLYTTAHGIISNTVYDLAITKNLIYASTRDGIFSIPKNVDLINKVLPEIRISSLRINGQNYDTTLIGLNLPYTKNSIELVFEVSSFRINENTAALRYQLKGSGDSLKETRSHSLSFSNLAPATYELIVYALNNDGLQSLKPVIIKFTIDPPFWKTWWFIFAVCFIVAMVGIVFLTAFVKRIRNREKENTRIHKLIAESQLSALQAQMNPHFIFNAINSIQNYILKRDEKKAFEYLGTFGKLIRIVLNHSRQTSVSLVKELELLKLYVELEQLRFKNVFSFTLKIAPELDEEDIEIPTMLIQPYVENAIWHGIMALGSQRQGHLLLDFSMQNNLLRIVIEDNGVGRTQSTAYKKSNIKSSLGMQLTEERIEKINELRGIKGMKVHITDLKNDKGDALGTRVELFVMPEMDKFYHA